MPGKLKKAFTGSCKKFAEPGLHRTLLILHWRKSYAGKLSEIIILKF